jgi:hypothetical protein
MARTGRAGGRRPSGSDNFCHRSRRETTHALAGLRAEHEALRGEYERVAHELRERCFAAEGRQHLAVRQLESLLGRLRQ